MSNVQAACAGRQARVGRLPAGDPRWAAYPLPIQATRLELAPSSTGSSTRNSLTAEPSHRARVSPF